MAIRISWRNPFPNQHLHHIEIWRKVAGGSFSKIGSNITDVTEGKEMYYDDGSGNNNHTYQIRFCNIDGNYRSLPSIESLGNITALDADRGVNSFLKHYNFIGETIDINEWIVTLPDSDVGYFRQNEGLCWYMLGGHNSGQVIWANKILNEVKRTTGVWNFSLINPTNEQSRLEYGLVKTNGDYSTRAVFSKGGALGTYPEIRACVIQNWGWISEVDTLRTDFIRCKIVLTSNSVSFYVWGNNSQWEKLGNTINITLSEVQFGMGSIGYLSKTVTIQDMYITSYDYNTIRP